MKPIYCVLVVVAFLIIILPKDFHCLTLPEERRGLARWAFPGEVEGRYGEIGKVRVWAKFRTEWMRRMWGGRGKHDHSHQWMVIVVFTHTYTPHTHADSHWRMDKYCCLFFSRLKITQFNDSLSPEISHLFLWEQCCYHVTRESGTISPSVHACLPFPFLSKDGSLSLICLTHLALQGWLTLPLKRGSRPL